MSVLLLSPNALLDQTDRALLNQIKPAVLRIAEHIRKTGLLYPIIVGAKALFGPVMKYRIVDGTKRLLAIKYLKATGLLPRSLEKVPCIEQDNQPANISRLPRLLSEAELARLVRQALRNGQSAYEVADLYECKIEDVEKMQSLTFLHPKVRAAFDKGDLNLAQAATFASFTNPDAQWRVLQQLGPFAKSKEIMNCLSSGQTMLELPGGDMLVLPSRNTPVTSSRTLRQPVAA